MSHFLWTWLHFLVDARLKQIQKPSVGSYTQSLVEGLSAVDSYRRVGKLATH